MNASAPPPTSSSGAEGPKGGDGSDSGRRRRLRAIFAADIANFSGGMSFNETSAVHTLTKLRKVTLGLLANHGGILHGMPGDGLFALFESAIDALQCALTTQSRLNSDPKLGAMKLRIGLHLGEVIFEDGLPFGEALSIAARLEALADPGGILVSGAVADATSARVSATFSDRGVPRLKNIPRRIQTFSVTPLLMPGDMTIAAGKDTLDKTTRVARNKSMSETQVKSATGPQGKGAYDTRAKSLSKSLSETRAKSVPEAPPKSLSETQAKTGTQSAAKTLAGAGAKSGSGLPAKSLSETQAKSLSETRAKSLSETQALSDLSATAIAKSKRKRVPDPAPPLTAPFVPAPPLPELPPHKVLVPKPPTVVAAAPPAPPPPAPPPPPKLPPPVSEGCLMQIVAALTVYIGPLARIIVRRRLVQGMSARSLCQKLEADIPSEAERNAFRHAVAYILAGLPE
jgi:class 3 adenylate cyclase